MVNAGALRFFPPLREGGTDFAADDLRQGVQIVLGQRCCEASVVVAGVASFLDNQAIAALLDGLPAGARVALIPEGPYAFAQVAE